MPSLAEIVWAYCNSDLLAERMRLAEELINQVGPALWGYIHRRVPEAAVDDTFQDVLTAIAEKLHTVRAETDDKIWKWCYRIAFFKCADSHRRKGPEIPVDIEELQRVVDAGAEVERISPGERMDLNYALALLAAAKPPCVELLLSHYVMEIDCADIAETSGETNDAVRMRIRRCLELAQELVTESP
jgi:RNA polymerase sigma factor (sigma-70 family)